MSDWAQVTDIYEARRIMRTLFADLQTMRSAARGLLFMAALQLLVFCMTLWWIYQQPDCAADRVSPPITDGSV